MPIDQPESTAHRLGDEARMSFGEHLEELRYRLILALLGPVVTTCVALYFGRAIVGWLVQPLAQVLRSEGLAPQTVALTVTGGFAAYLKVSLIAGLILASPWMVYQLWKFIEVGLYATERRAMLVVGPFSGLMSLLGVAFTYFLLLPVCLLFLIRFSTNFPPPDVSPDGRPVVLEWIAQFTDREVVPPTGELITTTQPGALSQVALRWEDPADPQPGQVWVKLPENELRVFTSGQVLSFAAIAGRSMITPNPEIGQYINFVSLLVLGVAVGFQVPVVMLVLGWSGLVDPAWLARYRKYCIFACFAMGALFTPQDPFSMVLLALPMWGLYELGLLLMRWTYRPPGGEDAGSPGA